MNLTKFAESTFESLLRTKPVARSVKHRLSGCVLTVPFFFSSWLKAFTFSDIGATSQQSNDFHNEKSELT